MTKRTLVSQGNTRFDSDALDRLVFALLFAADGPLGLATIAALVNDAFDEEEWPFPVTSQQVDACLRRLEDAQAKAGALSLVRVNQGARLHTHESLAPMVMRLWPERKLRLSKAALEALSVIAYRQPCTRLEVEAVRGVDCGGILRNLLERQLIRITGKKEEAGRPLLYGTTPTFLETFSLSSLHALPTLRDLEQLEAEERARAQVQVVLELPEDLQEQTKRDVGYESPADDPPSDDKDPDE
ncbi:MAG: SMC-Scp complex subunit ScpB [Myxococcota bacterium]|nr:SMC-Scp complex subunit ScpB [Myxococcota bacterium]